MVDCSFSWISQVAVDEQGWLVLTIMHRKYKILTLNVRSQVRPHQVRLIKKLWKWNNGVCPSEVKAPNSNFWNVHERSGNGSQEPVALLQVTADKENFNDPFKHRKSLIFDQILNIFLQLFKEVWYFKKMNIT